jgi:hypothetical protein
MLICKFALGSTLLNMQNQHSVDEKKVEKMNYSEGMISMLLNKSNKIKIACNFQVDILWKAIILGLKYLIIMK